MAWVQNEPGDGMQLPGDLHNGSDSKEPLESEQPSEHIEEELEWQELEYKQHPLSTVLNDIINCFEKIIQVETEKLNTLKGKNGN